MPESVAVNNDHQSNKFLRFPSNLDDQPWKLGQHERGATRATSWFNVYGAVSKNHFEKGAKEILLLNIFAQQPATQTIRQGSAAPGNQFGNFEGGRRVGRFEGANHHVS